MKEIVVLAFDPGFVNGCKIAVIDKNGKYLDSSVVKPFLKGNSQKYIEDSKINGRLCRWDKYSVNVNSFYLDITSEESIKSLYDRLKSMNIEINYLINNSGISLDNYIFDKSKEEFMKVLEVNTVGTFLMI